MCDKQGKEEEGGGGRGEWISIKTEDQLIAANLNCLTRVRFDRCDACKVWCDSSAGAHNASVSIIEEGLLEELRNFEAVLVEFFCARHHRLQVNVINSCQLVKAKQDLRNSSLNSFLAFF